MSGAVIEEGSRVIIQKGTYMRSEEVRRKIKVDVQKQHFTLDNAIGCFYGTTFRISKNGNLVMIPNDSGDVAQAQPKPPPISGENNQFLNDDGSSQKLTKDAIMDLKAQGFEGEDIIEQLIENSETFEKKTEFSQEKYLKKKRKRHLAQVTILKPTLRLVCEMMYANWPGKILDLRMDTVSQILTMANIHSNMDVLLLENTQSFLAGAILHRMAGRGNLVQLHTGDFPIRLLLPHFGLAEDEMKILRGFPSRKINLLHSLENEEVDEEPSEVAEEMETEEVNETTEQTCDGKEEKTSQNDKGPSNDNTGQNRRGKWKKHYNKPLTPKEKLTRKIQRADEEKLASELLKKTSFDCLIIATKYHAKSTVLRLIEFLAPSRPIVVYSPYKEVLNECYLALKEAKSVLNLDLTETWWRSYQVLAMRTHPHIMMDSSGGYLLTGIKVDPGFDDSTANPGENPNPAVNPPVNPNPAVNPPVNPNPAVNPPVNPSPSSQNKRNIKPVAPAGTSSINPGTDNDRDLEDNATNPKDNPEIKSDPDLDTKPDGDSVEPPAKRTKSS